MASFPLHWEADMQRTIVNAWLQDFTDRSLISSSLALHCSVNLVLVSGVMCRDPPSTSSILVQHTPSTSFKAVKSWADFGPGFVTVSQVPAGIYPIISTVLWLQKGAIRIQAEDQAVHCNNWPIK